MLSHQPITNAAEYDIVDNEEILPEKIQYSFYTIFKDITKLSLPMALSYTFSMEVFILTVLLSLISKDEDDLASIALTATMLNTLIILGMSPLFGMGIVTSKQIGELQANEKDHLDQLQIDKKHDEISQINKSALILGGIITPAVISSLFFSKDILVDVFRQNETCAEITQDFLRWYAVAVPGLMLRTSSEQILFSLGKSFHAMLMGLGSLGIGSGIAALLGLGGLGIKSLGSSGLAIGFIVESYLTAISYSLYTILHGDFKAYSFFNLSKCSSTIYDQFKLLLRVGLPITGTIATEIAASLVLGVIAGKIGEDEQIAMSAVLQFVFFNLILSSAFGQGCSQELSRLIGAREYNHASQVGKYGLMTSMIWTAPIPIVFGAAPSILMLTSDNKSNVYPIVKTLSPIISSGVFVDSVRYNLLQQLRGMNDNVIPAVISVSGLTIGMISGSMVGLNTNMGIYGLAAGYSGGMFLSALGLGIRWSLKINPKKIYNSEISQQINVTTAGLPTLFNRKHQRINEPTSLVNKNNMDENTYLKALTI